MKKRGQVTIFIILAIIIVAGILSFFYWKSPETFTSKGARLGFEGCVQDALEDSISRLEKTSGFIDPPFFYRYNDQKLQYLCYSGEYYKTCTVQVPFPEKYFEDQLKIDLRDEVDQCYSESVEDLKSQGYDVKEGVVTYEVTLEQGEARMKIQAPTTVGTQSFARFNVGVKTPIYEMLMIATSILQYESTLGDSDTDALYQLYPDYIITKEKMGDGTTVYIIESKLYGNKYQFASRSLAWPPGYDI